MSSAIGDILQNPNIEGSPANDKQKAHERSLMAKALQGAGNLGGRFFNSGFKAAASLPDAILNKNPLDLLEKALLGTSARKDPLEKFLRSVGLVRDLPKAETTGEKYAESFGDVVGGLAVPGGVAAKGAGAAGKLLGRALLGTKAPLTSARQLANPTFASTLGGAVAMGASNPTIEESFPDSPTAQFAASLGTGVVGGGLAGGLASSLLRKSPQVLPQATAAQRGNISDPRIRELTARQIELAKTDPKSADILNQISQNQEASILGKLNPETSISGKDIIKNIGESVENLKAQRSQDYQNAFASLLENSPNSQINIEKTINLLGDLQNKTAKGIPLQNAFSKATEIIAENADNPERLISAKIFLQDMAEYGGELSLGSKQSAQIKKVIKQLNSDIEASLPGYSEMNAQYAKQTENLENLLEGVAGKAGKFEANRPSQIVRQLFEKTDPELVDQLKQVLSPEIYEQAADMYLADVAKRGMGKYTPLEENNIQKFQKMAKIFEENSDVLMKTLPEKQRGIVQEVIHDVTQTGRGRPRNDFTVNSNRKVTVGDDVKGLGKAPSKIAETAGYLSGSAIGGGLGAMAGGPIGAGIGAGIGGAGTVLGKKLGNLASTSFRRNEMLTGQSPSSQVMQGLGNAGTRATQKGLAADSLTQELPQLPNQAPQEGLASNEANISQVPQTTSSSLDDLINEFNGAEPQNNSNTMEGGPMSQGNDAPASSLDDLIKEFENSGQSPDQNLMKKIKGRESGNNYQAMNEQGYSGAYQMGAQALEDVGLIKQGASRAGNQSLEDPNNWTIPGGKNEFLSDPQLQDMAIQEFMRLNEQRMTAKGLINKDTPQNQRDGHLAAAHLGGVGGAAALARGLMRKDANGTSTRNYYNMGAGA